MPYRLKKDHRPKGALRRAGELYHPTSTELRAFSDVFEVVDDVEPLDEGLQETSSQGHKPGETEPVVYHIVHRGGGWYDVLLPDGTPENETALREHEAQEFCAELQRRRTRG